MVSIKFNAFPMTFTERKHYVYALCNCGVWGASSSDMFSTEAGGPGVSHRSLSLSRRVAAKVVSWACDVELRFDLDSSLASSQFSSYAT